MKLMIEINDNEYMGIKAYPNNITSYPVTIHLYDAVRNGIPLEQEPKTDKVIKMREATSEEQKSVYEYIKSISKPTGVDFLDSEQEPKTGHWIIYDVHGHKACKCSECDKDVGYPCNYKYCPYCGHFMIKPQESENNV